MAGHFPGVGPAIASRPTPLAGQTYPRAIPVHSNVRADHSRNQSLPGKNFGKKHSFLGLIALSLWKTFWSMAIVRSVVREMPDGSFCSVYPFHLSLEGLESAIICRDEEDYDALVKCLFVCSLKKNVLIVTYVVVSNHLHAVILAVDENAAREFGNEVRRRYAMWFSRKYKERKLYKNKCVDVQWLDTDWYLRNAIAYVFRNALDNGDSIEVYPWSGYRAAFSKGKGLGGVRPVSSFTKREREAIFHTNDKIENTRWLVDDEDRLVPSSACETSYLEAAFDGSQAFLLKTIGLVNMAEMNQKLVVNPRKTMLDGEFYKHLTTVSERWFSKPVADLSLEEKMRLLPYINRTTSTNIPQLARAFGLSRKEVAEILQRNR